jgi:Tfp pilus assembly protein PilF
MYQMALIINPLHAVSRVKIGTLLIKDGQVERAMQVFSKAEKLPFKTS